MKDMVVGCTAGKVEGQVVLDLSKEEDNFGQADLPMAVLPKSGNVVLLQMDGDLSVDEFEKATSMILEATKKIHKIQRDALAGKYKAIALERSGE
jgi:ribosomal RNA-processing protein RRP41/SKI6 (EC 3.1.13.-)